MIEVRVYRTYAKNELLDPIPKWDSLNYSTSLHGGFKDCHLVAPMELGEIWLYLQRLGQEGRHFAHLEIVENQAIRWEGRIISAGFAISSGVPSLALGALGYWSSCHDQRITTVDYSAGVHTVDSIIKAMLTAKCPNINSDQSNIDAVAGNVQLVLPVDKYTTDHIIKELAPLGDSSDNTYYAAVWEDRLFHYHARSIDAVDWKVRLRDISRGSLMQAAQHLRTRADAWDGAARTAEAYDADAEKVYPIRDMVVSVPSGTTAARAEDARDRFIQERKDPQQTSQFTITAQPLQVTTFGPVTGNLMSAVRAGDVVRIIGLIPASAASPQLDNLRTFYLLETRYDAGRNVLTMIPDRPPSRLDVLLARQGIELTR